MLLKDSSASLAALVVDGLGALEADQHRPAPLRGAGLFSQKNHWYTDKPVTTTTSTTTTNNNNTT